MNARQRGLIAGLFGVTMVAIVAGFGLFRQQANPRSVQWTLAKRPGANSFILSVKNYGSKAVGVFLYSWSYEVRVFDKDGKKMSDQSAFSELVNVPAPSEKDFVILGVGSNASIELVAYNRHGVMQLDDGANSADCLATTRQEGDALILPEKWRNDGITCVHMDKCNTLRLK